MNVVCHDTPREWDEYVAAHPAATSYHRFGWKRVIERSFGHKTDYLVAIDNDGKLRGVLPITRFSSLLFGKFFVSLPFFNYGGLLTDSSEAEELLLQEAGQRLDRAGAAYLELRHRGVCMTGLPVKTHKVTMILDLEHDVDAQWSRFNPKLRNQIRKAQKSDLSVKIGSVELLDGFYTVFCRNMRDLGTPVYGKKFFEEILDAFTDSVRIITVFHGATPIASGMLSWFRDTVEIPWASSIRDYKEFCPNNLLYWEALRFAIMNGFRTFDFGRSTPDEGTFKFKQQWGAQPVQLYWHYLMRNNASLPQLNTKNPKYDMAIRVWQKLPLGIANLAGPFIVKDIP